MPNTVAGRRRIGRAVDDGLIYQIADSAVRGTDRFHGPGKVLGAALMTHLNDIAPTVTYVSATADDAAHRLYA